MIQPITNIESEQIRSLNRKAFSAALANYFESEYDSFPIAAEELIETYLEEAKTDQPIHELQSYNTKLREALAVARVLLVDVFSEIEIRNLLPQIDEALSCEYSGVSDAKPKA